MEAGSHQWSPVNSEALFTELPSHPGVILVMLSGCLTAAQWLEQAEVMPRTHQAAHGVVCSTSPCLWSWVWCWGTGSAGYQGCFPLCSQAWRKCRWQPDLCSSVAVCPTWKRFAGFLRTEQNLTPDAASIKPELVIKHNPGLGGSRFLSLDFYCSKTTTAQHCIIPSRKVPNSMLQHGTSWRVLWHSQCVWCCKYDAQIGAWQLFGFNMLHHIIKSQCYG